MGDTKEPGCALCEGRCPECGGDVGEAAGSANWVLCSMCHATFLHDHGRERPKRLNARPRR